MPETDANPAAADVAAASPITQNYPELPQNASNASPSFTPDGLTPTQRVALAALVSGQTLAAAAARAGVCRKTLFNWRRQPAFNRALTELGREAMEAAAARTRIILLKATRAITAELDMKYAAFPAAMRVIACKRMRDGGREFAADLTEEAEPNAQPAVT